MDLDGALIEQIYEAAAVHELWPQVFQQLCLIAGAWAAGLVVFDPLGHVRYVSTPNYEDGLSDFMRNGAGYENLRPARAIASGHAGFMTDLEVLTPGEHQFDPIYRDFLRPRGIEWTAGTVIPVPTADLIVFDLARRQADGPFDRAAMLALDRYRPHLARSALFAQRLGLRTARAATEAMASLGLPAAMLSGSGRVIAANTGFAELAPRVLVGAFDRLHLANHAAERLLLRGLQQPPETPGGVLSVPIAADEQAPALVAHLVPVRRAGRDIFVQSAALLVVTPVVAPAAPLTELLTGLFDLTPAEVRVARGIAAGQTVEQIAAAASLSRETVRSHLKSVMGKTGTSRQVELVLLLSGAARLGR